MSLKPSHESSYYEILEIDPNATGREVHQAYVRARDTYSPDSPALYTMFTPDEARELLKVIDEAFAILSNQMKRQEYDLSLAKKGHPAFKDLLNKPQSTSHSSTAYGDRLKPVTSIVGEEGAVLKSARISGPREELPQGFARTKFGVYELNPTLEKEMTHIEECDGSFLQKIRQYKKVNLDQLCESTRISKNYLSAIESNAIESLPAAVFVRGFVLQFVRALGAPDRVVDAYMKRYRKNLS